MKKKLSLTNLCMNLVQGQCKPNAESSLYAEVQPVLAFRRQSYAIFRHIVNFLAFISPTYSDKRLHKRQIKLSPSKLVMSRQFI